MLRMSKYVQKARKLTHFPPKKSHAAGSLHSKAATRKVNVAHSAQKLPVPRLNSLWRRTGLRL